MFVRIRITCLYFCLFLFVFFVPRHTESMVFDDCDLCSYRLKGSKEKEGDGRILFTVWFCPVISLVAEGFKIVI